MSTKKTLFSIVNMSQLMDRRRLRKRYIGEEDITPAQAGYDSDFPRTRPPFDWKRFFKWTAGGFVVTLLGLAAWFCFQWNAQMGSFPKLLKSDFYKNLKLELKMWHNLESKYRGTYGKFNGTYRREGDSSRRLLVLSSGNFVSIRFKPDEIEIEGVYHITWHEKHNGRLTKNNQQCDIELVDENGDTSKRIILSQDSEKRTYFPHDNLTEIQLTQLKAATHPDLTAGDKLLIKQL